MIRGIEMGLLNQKFRYKKNLHNSPCFLKNKISKCGNQVCTKNIKYILKEFFLSWLGKKEVLIFTS